MVDARTWEEAAQEFMATVTQETDLSDPNEASRIRGISVAAGRMQEIGDLLVVGLIASFGLDCTGQALRDRVGEIKGFKQPLPASPAQGAVMRFLRESAVGVVSIPAGTQVTDGTNYYLTVADYFSPDGVEAYPSGTLPYAYVVSTTPGRAGNVPTGSITRMVSDVPGIIGCQQVKDLDNGLPEETDAEIQRRAALYIAGGLTQLTPQGLRAFAESYVAPDGSRCRPGQATISVHREKPLARLIVSDGRGFAGATAPAQSRSGTVFPGQRDFHCDYPVVEDTVRLRVNGVEVPWVGTLRGETGRVMLDEDEPLPWETGDTWECSGHTVRRGLPMYLQRAVEGGRKLLGVDPGRRGTGVRIIVTTPTMESVRYNLLLVVGPGPDDYDRVAARVRAAIVAFHERHIPQGQAALPIHLYPLVERIPQVVEADFRSPDDDELPAEPAYPASEEHQLTTAGYLIKINGQYGT